MTYVFDFGSRILCLNFDWLDCTCRSIYHCSFLHLPSSDSGNWISPCLLQDQYFYNLSKEQMEKLKHDKEEHKVETEDEKKKKGTKQDQKK